MINVAEVIAGNEGKKHGYARKLNTASMIQKVVSCLHIEGLTGEGLWHLVSLTWITKSGKKVSPDYWKTYKIPALAYCFGKGQIERRDLHNLPSSLAALGLPDAAVEAANEETGIVNFYAARRKSALQRSSNRSQGSGSTRIWRGVRNPGVDDFTDGVA